MRSFKLFSQGCGLQKIRGTVLVGIGFLLSPLCWWNDLIINLPLAYGFGYLCSKVSEDFLFPGLIAGYWLTNVVGFLLMQMGVGDMIQDPNQQRNPKKELLTGLATSTVFTMIVLAFVQFHLIEIPDLRPEQLAIQLKSFF